MGVANDAKLADEVARIIGHFSAGWDKKVSDTELFQIVQRCAMLIGQVLEFENEVDGNTETCSALVKNFCDSTEYGNSTWKIVRNFHRSYQYRVSRLYHST